jgi:L-threonylcarbamoyladenylate synthase
MKPGDIIIIPTDTVFGLAARLYDDVALERIYRLKGREQSKQIPVLVASLEDVTSFAKTDDRLRRLAEAFWPGPLSIVVPTTDAHLEKTGERTVAVRMPADPVALELLSVIGPLRATSLNKSGEPPVVTYEDALERFADKVDHVHGGPDTVMSETASTVIAFDHDEVRILRQGAITKDMIASVLSD